MEEKKIVEMLEGIFAVTHQDLFASSRVVGEHRKNRENFFRIIDILKDEIALIILAHLIDIGGEAVIRRMKQTDLKSFSKIKIWRYIGLLERAGLVEINRQGRRRRHRDSNIVCLPKESLAILEGITRLVEKKKYQAA